MEWNCHKLFRSECYLLLQLIQQKSIHFSFFPTIQLDASICIILGRQNLRMTFLSMIFSKVGIEKSVKKNVDKFLYKVPFSSIGNRKSSNFFRIYQKKDGLEFELEIKKTPLKSFQDLLFSEQIQQFESESSYYFLKSFANIFPISYCFMDWLAVSLSPKISHSNLVNPLISEYIQVDHFIPVADKKYLFLLLQLLSFLQSFDAYERIYTRTVLFYNHFSCSRILKVYLF